MNFFNKIFNIFKRKQHTELLNEPKEATVSSQESRKTFIESLQVTSIANKKTEKNIKTRICPGNGLGIYNNFSS